MASSVSEIVIQNQPVVHDVEALVQAAVSVLTNDMAIATHDSMQTSHGEQVQLLVDSVNSNSIQDRLYMCTDCNLAFYGEQGEQEWQWHLKQHKPFKCDLCAEAYEDKDSLKTHVRSHSIQMPFVCDKCGSAYSLKSNLTQHMKSHEDKLFQCSECQVGFKSQGSLEKHLKMHSGETISLFQCETCSKTFTQQKNLVQHIKIHQGNGGKQYKCPECPAAYSYKCHLSRHLIIHTGEKPYKCKFCGKAFNRNAHLIRHRKMHSGAEKEWKCNQCGFAFWEKGDLMRHVKSHEGNRPLKCDYCEQTFVWKRYLYKHLNTHHKADDQHFCKTCLACLPSEEELIHHEMADHSDKRPLTHTCEICGEEFHFKYKLDEHMYTHTGEKAHACQKCPQKFVSRKELDRHVIEHQQEVSFCCNTCEQTFSNIEELQMHVKLHTGSAKYICSVCRATFRWRSQLTSHMVVHSNDQDFKCGLCIKKFKRKRDLTRHVKIFHDTKPPYTCIECSRDFHSPYNLMQHKMETHWKNQDIEPGKYSCKHCTGAFGIKSDLERHLNKVHPPRPNICILCSKRFTLMKFLQKHFEVKHEGEEMIEGKNYEVKIPEPEVFEAVESVVVEDTENQQVDMVLEMEATNEDDHEEDAEFQDNGELQEIDCKNEDSQDKLVIQGLQSIANSLMTDASENIQAKIEDELKVPISEAITLAQFAQQGTDDSAIPVFLQENMATLQQSFQQQMTPVQAAPQYMPVKTMASLPQITTAVSTNTLPPQITNIPRVVRIPHPQTLQVQQSAVPTASAPVRVLLARKNQPFTGTPVKIPIINKAGQNAHIIVQKGAGPNREIKIIQLPQGLNTDQQQKVLAQSVPLQGIGNVPNWSLTSVPEVVTTDFVEEESETSTANFPSIVKTP